MKPFPLNAWYAAAYDVEVKAALLSRTLCNQKLVMFRKTDGQVAVLEDACWHRLLPLSLGRLEGDEVVCGYHGLVFNGDGRCTHMPSQETLNPSACVRSYPLIEKHRFVWVWPGDPAKADPALIPDAVEELLRLTSPVQGLARMTTRDVQIEDTTIPAGRKTFLLYGSGNRDDRHWGPDAEELNVLRRPAQILTFSHGNHHCLGAAAARMQARVALEELLTRCPDFSVDTDAVEYAEGSYVRRPTHLPFTAHA